MASSCGKLSWPLCRAVEQREPRARQPRRNSSSEIAAVEVGVCSGDRLGHVEQAVARRSLKPAADAELVEFQSRSPRLRPRDGAASSRDALGLGGRDRPAPASSVS